MHGSAFIVFLSLSTTSATAAFNAAPCLHRRFQPVVASTVPKDSYYTSSLPRRKYRSISFRPFRRNRRTPIFALKADGDGDEAEIEGVTGVTLKMAFDSSDAWGVADLSETKSERFTSPESLDMVHRLRRESSAILVGRFV